MTSYLPKLMITGGEGQVAKALRSHPLAKAFQILSFSRADLDIIDSQAVTNTITHVAPDVVINTAAYTAVDKAEKEAYQAMHINYQGAKTISIACAKNQIFLIHLSTDYIFDGNTKTPYQETDLPNPINVYGESKWLGEQAVRDYCERHIILRTSGIFSEYGQNFFKTMLSLASSNKKLQIVADQVTCPTDAFQLARVLLAMAQTLAATGTYHYCDSGPTSWYQFAVDIIDAAKAHQPLLVDEIKAITTAEYPTAAKRPAYSVLQCSKIEKDFGIAQETRAAAIQRILTNRGNHG